MRLGFPVSNLYCVNLVLSTPSGVLGTKSRNCVIKFSAELHSLRLFQILKEKTILLVFNKEIFGKIIVRSVLNIQTIHAVQFKTYSFMTFSCYNILRILISLIRNLEINSHDAELYQ